MRVLLLVVWMMMAVGLMAGPITVGAEGGLERDGQRFVLVEMGSPENRVIDYVIPSSRDTEIDRLLYLRAAGANTVWWSVWCGDDPRVRLTDRTFGEYRSYAVLIASLGLVSHVVVSEHETHGDWRTDEERRAHYARVARLFEGLDAPVIVCLGEELRTSWQDRAAWERMLREELARVGVVAPVSIHNWPGERPWEGTTADLIAWQGSDAAEIPRIADRAFYASERNPYTVGVPSDSADGVRVGLEWFWGGWRAGDPWFSGAGLYSGYIQDGCTDLGCDVPSVHNGTLLAWRASAAVVARGGGPADALVLGVPVPGSVAQPDGNGDGVHDAADALREALGLSPP